MPKAIRSFLDRRADCDHYAGEDPYDADRARFLAQAETRLGCDRLDADAKALRRRYVGHHDLLRLLEATQD